MYADLGPGQMLDLDPPSQNGADLLYSHEYVASYTRRRQLSPPKLTERVNLLAYAISNPIRYVDPFGLAITQVVCSRTMFSPGSTLPLYAREEQTFLVQQPPATQQTACPIGWQFVKWVTLVGDEATVASICNSMTVPAASCANCSVASCERSLIKFLAAVRSTWIANILGMPIGPNTCERWVFDLESRLPNFGLGDSCISNAEVVTFKLQGGVLSTRHVAYKLTMCDGTVVYADNGAWGGSDHLFFPTDIPGYATPE